MKLEEIKMKWTSGAACPFGLSLNDVCHILKKDGKLYFTNGNLELPTDEESLKNLFTLMDDVIWDEAEFNIQSKVNKK